MLTNILSISLGAILINNFIFSQFLGCCPFLGCSNKMDTAVGMGQGGTLPAVGTPVADIDTILSVGEQYKDVVKATSIADLAKAIGCDEKTLSDSLGGKDTTYYAVVCAGYSYATVGGLDVDANMSTFTSSEDLYSEKS